MKNFKIYLSIFVIVLASCQSTETEVEKKTDDTQETNSQSKSSEEVVADNEPFLSVKRWNSLIGNGKDYYILNYAGVADEQKAISEVNTLKKDYPNAGYLWIPDFESLSGKEIFAVFLDQTSNQSEILQSLEKTKEELPDVYVVKVNQSNERWVAYWSNDIRINGKRIATNTLKEIFIYETPDQIDDYAESGGEDWGYFTEDVSAYFRKKYPAVKVGNFYHSSLSKDKIKQLEKKLDLKSRGFGYIVIDGDASRFIEHNMSDEVISEATKFFGFKK